MGVLSFISDLQVSLLMQIAKRALKGFMRDGNNEALVENDETSNGLRRRFNSSDERQEDDLEASLDNGNHDDLDDDELSADEMHNLKRMLGGIAAASCLAIALILIFTEA